MSDNSSAGLPMTAKWDPERLARENAALAELDRKPLRERIKGYYKLTGPAWMQSAMTLGAGSAAASVVAGAFYGYQLLWVQPIAMFLGICMMAALGNITLTKGERAYEIVKREIHPSVAFLWALATVVATTVWHFGQYALLGGAAFDLANVATGAGSQAPMSKGMETVVRFAAGFLILGINIGVTWSYGSKPTGIKAYEKFIQWMVRLVMLAFFIVVGAQIIHGRIDWGAMFKGFFVPSVPSQPGSLTTTLGAIGAAVGINMTFLYPYSILAKGWGPNHKGLARFDLTTSLLIPYTILTSLIIIGMASTIHQAPFGTILASQPKPSGLQPIEAAQALTGVLGGSFGRIVFDLGFIGMCCGAISAHMVCCGFTVCEMFGLKYTPARYKLFTLVPAIGVFGVMVKSPIWLPVIASAIAFTMLPIAYISFFYLNNKRSYLGDAVPKGPKGRIWNILLLIAVIMSIIGATIQIKTRVIDKIFHAKPPAAATK